MAFNRFALPSDKEPNDEFDPLSELQLWNEDTGLFSPLNAAQSLDNIATIIGEDPTFFPLDIKGSYAIPSTISHIINYEKEVLRELKRVNTNEARAKRKRLSPVLNEWLGMLSAVLLKGVYGLHVKLEKMDLWRPDNNRLGTIVGELLHEHWKSYNAKKNPSKKDSSADVMRLCYLTIGGEAFAILDPIIGLCPLKVSEFDFKGIVPWCMEGVWENPLDVWDKKASQGLPSTESQMLYDFLDIFANAQLEGKSNRELKEIFALLKEYIAFYKRYNTPMVLKKNVPVLDEEFSEDQNFAEYDWYLRELMFKNAKAEEMPRNFFTPKLLLFPMTKRQYLDTEKQYQMMPAALRDQRPLLVNDNDLNGKKNTDEVLCYLPPLSTEAVEYFGKHSATMRTTFALKPDLVTISNGSQLAMFTFTVDFTLPSGCWITKQHSFVWNRGDTKDLALKEIVYLNAPPYISLWPNVSYGKAVKEGVQTDGAAEEDSKATYWNIYYLAKFSAARFENPMIVLNHCFGLEDDSQQLETLYHIAPLGSDELLMRLDSAYVPFGETVEEKIFSEKSKSSISRQRKKEWTMFRSSTRPEQVEIFIDTQLCGVLQIPRCEKKMIIEDKTGQLGLDFGTASTMCYINYDGIPQPRSIRPAEAYLLDIIPFASRLYSGKEANYEESTNARFQWVQRTDNLTSLKKINTSMQANSVAPKPERALIDNTYYPFYFARHQHLDGEVWDELCGTGDNGIYLNLKFSADGSAAMKDVRKTFFSYVLMLATLDARENGIDKLDLYASFPNLTALGNLSEALDHTMPLVNEHFFGGIFHGEVQYRKETTAAINYFRRTHLPGDAVSVRNGLVIVDIGGGTTDISVVQSELGPNGEDQLKPPASESIRFAGDVLLRESLIYALTTVDKSSAGERLTAVFNGSGSPNAESVRTMFIRAYNNKMSSVNSDAPFDDKTRQASYGDLAEIIESLLREPGFKPDYSKVTGRNSLSCPDESSEFAAIRCFSEVIKLRYLLLFYLIASHMKNSTALCDYRQFKVINICLAGYGSRGLGFCTGTEIGSNGRRADAESPYIELVQKLMAKVLEVDKVSILLPSANEKEEVAWGLLEKATIAATQDHEAAKQNKGKKKTSLSGDRAEDDDRFEAAYDRLVDAFTDLFEMDGLPPFSRRFTAVWEHVLKQAESQRTMGANWMDVNRDKEYVAEQEANIPDGSAALAFVESIDKLIGSWKSIPSA